MRIGVPKESRPGETRVAATPKTVSQMVGLGYEVVVEAGAGARASFGDTAYQEAGAAVAGPDEVWPSDIILKVNAPSDEEISRLRPGAILAGLLAPALSPDLVEHLTAQGVTALAMDAVPRISRAQSLDVLSSMANIGGYRAVVEAAHEFGSFFTGQVTAAGKVPPAKVLIVGAGVAGLAAIGTANSLGAIVRAFDARAEVGEQVESMGAEFLRIDVEDEGPSATGYAKEMGEDFNRKAAELYAEQAKDVDIIITTALIPGRPAPRLITADMVASMKPGSVIVDMAAANGGNVEGTRPDELVMTDNQVRIIGYTDLAGPAADPGLPALRHQRRQPAQAADPGQGRQGRRRLRGRGPAGHDRVPGRPVHVAAATGPGQRGARCGRPGRGAGPARAETAGPETHLCRHGARGRAVRGGCGVLAGEPSSATSRSSPWPSSSASTSSPTSPTPCTRR